MWKCFQLVLTVKHVTDTAHMWKWGAFPLVIVDTCCRLVNMAAPTNDPSQACVEEKGKLCSEKVFWLSALEISNIVYCTKYEFSVINLHTLTVSSKKYWKWCVKTNWASKAEHFIQWFVEFVITCTVFIGWCVRANILSPCFHLPNLTLVHKILKSIHVNVRRECERKGRAWMQ